MRDKDQRALSRKQDDRRQIRLLKVNPLSFLHPEAENVWSKAIARLAADESLRARFGAFNEKRIREVLSA